MPWLRSTLELRDRERVIVTPLPAAHTLLSSDQLLPLFDCVPQLSTDELRARLELRLRRPPVGIEMLTLELRLRRPRPRPRRKDDCEPPDDCDEPLGAGLGARCPRRSTTNIPLLSSEPSSTTSSSAVRASNARSERPFARCERPFASCVGHRSTLPREAKTQRENGLVRRWRPNSLTFFGGT
jgi:hypothetical protein